MEEKETDSVVSEANSGGGPFASNALRLTPRQWTVTVLLLAAVYIALPRLWIYAEPFSADADYRIPYSLSADYWLYHRYAGEIAATDRIPVIGDSVVWGQYVVAEDSLSHFLNGSFGEDRFANMGVNGTHPVALAGLVRHYGQAIRNRKVILHLNPLWLSSKRHDLRDERARRFNHPDLVPQFYPEIPSYKASFPDRLSVIVERESAVLSWSDHIRIAYYGKKGVPLWSIEHPYRNPLGPVTGVLPKDGNAPPSDPIPWVERDLRLHDFDWVSLNESLQWRFFEDTVETLVRRGNEVFVILGPFNEHMLTPANRETYRERRAAMIGWIAGRDIPFVAPEPLPTELYADASHPIAAGYKHFAEGLLADPGFRSFVKTR